MKNLVLDLKTMRSEDILHSKKTFSVFVINNQMQSNQLPAYLSIKRSKWRKLSKTTLTAIRIVN